MEKKRFILFGCDRFYPSGGMSDARGTFDTEEELSELCTDVVIASFGYYDVFDTETFEIGKAGSPMEAFNDCLKKSNV